GSLRGGPIDRDRPAVDANPGGPDDAGGEPGGAEDRLEQVRGGGLSVRAGHADRDEGFRRTAEERRGQRSHGPANGARLELRTWHVEPPLDHERRGARARGPAREVVAIGVLSRDTEEHRAGADLARSIDDVGDEGARISAQLVAVQPSLSERVEQLPQRPSPGAVRRGGFDRQG